MGGIVGKVGGNFITHNDIQNSGSVQYTKTTQTSSNIAGVAGYVAGYVLSNGNIIKLIGIKTIKKTEKDAIEFLNGKFKNRKVFLKYDEIKKDKNNNDLAYIYLDNKTFINNHLLRTGFVDVDRSYEYKNKHRTFVRCLLCDNYSVLPLLKNP